MKLWNVQVSGVESKSWLKRRKYQARFSLFSIDTHENQMKSTPGCQSRIESLRCGSLSTSSRVFVVEVWEII
jgi:hypothetical protein